MSTSDRTIPDWHAGLRGPWDGQVPERCLRVGLSAAWLCLCCTGLTGDPPEGGRETPLAQASVPPTSPAKGPGKPLLGGFVTPGDSPVSTAWGCPQAGLCCAPTPGPEVGAALPVSWPGPFPPPILCPSSQGLPAPLPAVGEGRVRTGGGGQISGFSGGGEGKAVRLPKSVNMSPNIYLYRYPVCMCETDRWRMDG